MVFTDLQMLVPSMKSNQATPMMEQPEKIRKDSYSHNLQPVLQNQNYDGEVAQKNYQASNINPASKNLELFEQDDIKKVLEDMDEDKRELLEKLSQSDEDILQYLNNTMLENEPTEVLIK
mmetsp:Transcript_23059/g.20477  ORF Transcript_23059/g.20477 Transcript_23059/m.20477 type:complete len:120 (+) Transcript_23059:127-486(+)|eukprot:CAMPEP_0205807934 /NCGR_PEP_ID=MMETSP0205-20121125/11755_1 /ASSEMBLY_ACC=CAM_ASM_000278 /TAXON_ID=36767 /ORGANISM="Euplotes focardii, Strain TN1" /LENGTH=119 /DNA_ID=CAMNT_0053082843 /DNA_START=111 /DNA_END=470 /DNA_ORIENTATION=+